MKNKLFNEQPFLISILAGLGMYAILTIISQHNCRLDKELLISFAVCMGVIYFLRK